MVADAAADWPLIEDVTAGFVYVRLHDARELFASGYTAKALDDWARKIHRWAEGGTPQDTRRITSAPPIDDSGREIYAYFDNDMKVHAPRDAMALSERLGLPGPRGAIHGRKDDRRQPSMSSRRWLTET